jgi:MYXO-CTERM domain-containing protein
VDSTGNVYFAGYSNAGGGFVTTPGTYSTTATSSFNRGFFAKLSPVLPTTSTSDGGTTDGSSTDGGDKLDGGNADGGGKKSSGGCGCEVGGREPSATAAGLLLLAALAAARRRVRHPKRSAGTP